MAKGRQKGARNIPEMVIEREEDRFVSEKRPLGYRVGPLSCSAAMRNKKEREVLDECKKYLCIQKAVWWRRIDGSGKKFAGKTVKSENVGFPDLLIINKGLTIGVEIKRPWGGKLAEEQAKFLASMIKHGAVGCVVCSVLGLIDMLQGKEPTAMLETQFGVIPTWY